MGVHGQIWIIHVVLGFIFSETVKGKVIAGLYKLSRKKRKHVQTRPFKGKHKDVIKLHPGEQDLVMHLDLASCSFISCVFTSCSQFFGGHSSQAVGPKPCKLRFLCSEIEDCLNIFQTHCIETRKLRFHKLQCFLPPQIPQLARFKCTYFWENTAAFHTMPMNNDSSNLFIYCSL